MADPVHQDIPHLLRMVAQAIYPHLDWGPYLPDFIGPAHYSIPMTFLVLAFTARHLPLAYLFDAWSKPFILCLVLFSSNLCLSCLVQQLWLPLEYHSFQLKHHP